MNSWKSCTLDVVELEKNPEKNPEEDESTKYGILNKIIVII